MQFQLIDPLMDFFKEKIKHNFISVILIFSFYPLKHNILKKIIVLFFAINNIIYINYYRHNAHI